MHLKITNLYPYTYVANCCMAQGNGVAALPPRQETGICIFAILVRLFCLQLRTIDKDKCILFSGDNELIIVILLIRSVSTLSQERGIRQRLGSGTLTTPARWVACGPPYLRLIGIVSISRRSGFSGAQGPLFFSELP